jgi:hypothetical protein
VTSKPTFKKLFYLCLILSFILTGCSNEDQTQEQAVVEKKPEAEKTVTAAKPAPQRNMAPKDIPKGFRQDYSMAMQALRDEDYASANDYLMQAIEGKSDEKKVLKFYGMRYGSYLPHYYLGRTAYLTGDCESALTHWDTSLAQGVIQETPSYDYLTEATAACKSAN